MGHDFLLYVLQLGLGCEQVINPIKVTSVEEADFNLAAATFGCLENSDLGA